MFTLQQFDTNTLNDSQVYSRLNHLSVTISYSAVLKLVTKISKLNQRPINARIGDGACFNFVGDNVAKKKGVIETYIVTTMVT